METRRVVIRGRVQGVGFRWFVVENARRLDVRGTVRNRPDGAVEALLQGESRDAIEALIDRLRDGPPGARVEDVEVEAVTAPVSEHDRMSVVR